MRIRHKPWARPELEACTYYIKDGSAYKGAWRSKFPDGESKPLYAELGSGKGAFISAEAFEHPDINFIACDIKSEMLAYARRKAEKLFDTAETGRKVDNLLLLTLNIEYTETAFGENELDRIFINFCPPWRRAKEFKHRLTHPNMLVQYAKILKPGAEIHFKTDDDNLFNDSLEWFAATGFELARVEYDLQSCPDIKDNITTEHEEMFVAQGKKIKFLIAKNQKGGAENIN
jgi:tRNA (guanine-N7-)-methyltransferase